ncbi:MAG: hypothetical protein QXP42_04670 [Candidatus Micrarchaeia archaeon]
MDENKTSNLLTAIYKTACTISILFLSLGILLYLAGNTISASFLLLGVGAFVFAPLLGVVSLLIYYLKRRDRNLFLLTLWILLILVLSVFIKALKTAPVQH